MKDFLRKAWWSPYIVGAGIGTLACSTIYFMHHSLGVSTSFVRFVGYLENIIAHKHFLLNSYFAHYFNSTPLVNWQFSLVISIFFGSLIASKISGSSMHGKLPTIWKKRFGAKRFRRYIVACFGGILVLFGARLAGGCTLGHGISGGLKLALSGWLFLVFLFLGAIVTAFIVYKK